MPGTTRKGVVKAFDAGNQQALLATVDELIAADGQVHASEAKFRDEIRALLTAEIPLDERDVEHVPPRHVGTAQQLREPIQFGHSLDAR